MGSVLTGVVGTDTFSLLPCCLRSFLCCASSLSAACRGNTNTSVLALSAPLHHYYVCSMCSHITQHIMRCHYCVAGHPDKGNVVSHHYNSIIRLLTNCSQQVHMLCWRYMLVFMMNFHSIFKLFSFYSILHQDLHTVGSHRYYRMQTYIFQLSYIPISKVSCQWWVPTNWLCV